MGILFAKSKWNGHDIVHKNYSYHVVSIFFVAIYHILCSDQFVNDLWKEQYKIYILIHLLAKQNHSLKKWIWLVVVLLALRWYFTSMFTKPNWIELYCLSNISPSKEAAPELANLSTVLTKYIFCYVLI